MIGYELAASAGEDESTEASSNSARRTSVVMVSVPNGVLDATTEANWKVIDRAIQGRRLMVTAPVSDSEKAA
ncbi:hypothetical protein ON010_g14757 [Phytophthora cinnamomi]|nr:hypothetical protein ON010_g14757 [Phytophthora cinnamomi]